MRPRGSAPAPWPGPAPGTIATIDVICPRYGYEILVLEDHRTYDDPELVTADDAAQAAAQADQPGVHTDGLPVHMKPGSTLHADEQPSPFVVL